MRCASAVLLPALLALFATTLTSGTAYGQKRAKKKKLPSWAIDPYTNKNDPSILKKVGYVSYGPFEFGDNGTTSTDVSATLGKAKIRWIETKHFKFGLDLSPWAIPNNKALKLRIRNELAELQERGFVKISPRVRRLDPWLRIHLNIMRLEKLYEDFEKRLGVTEKDFPTKRNTFINNKYMGEGPYLGQPSKYTILVTRKLADYSRYLQTYIGVVQEQAKRHNFKQSGSLFLGSSEELESNRNKNDVALHTHLVWNTTHNLLCGFRLYTHDLPVWWSEGCAHWFARKISKKWDNFDQNESAVADLRAIEKWNVKTRQYIGRGNITPIAELINWRDFGQLKFRDHVISWSLVDFVMNKYGDKGFRDYMFEMHEILDAKTGKNLARDIPGLQRKAMRKAWKTNALKLTEEWKEWVLSTYPVK
ncbi:MAG: hypothetical protein CSA62_02995 [Planctomycetota bacterium]|nr:MAG: hypothetical protein CSA62_02995 [Planctomycetota bacterium]